MKTGQVKQVAAFEKLLGFCSAHGAMYNPGKDSLTVTALNSLLTSAQQSLEAVKDLQTAYNSAVNIRSQAYAELPKFMTRVINGLATSAEPATVEEAYFYLHKLRPVTKTRPAIPSGNAGVSADQSAKRSTSQLDYDRKADNFAAFVKVVLADPSYAPNEPDLKSERLLAKVQSIRGMNTALGNMQVALSNGRANRDKVLYSASGIYGIGKSVKRYIKSVFGHSSVGYGQVSGLRFLSKKNE